MTHREAFRFRLRRTLYLYDDRRLHRTLDVVKSAPDASVERIRNQILLGGINKSELKLRAIKLVMYNNHSPHKL